MRLYLIRHPVPVVNSDTCYGSSDVDVDAQQRDSVCAALLNVLPRDVALYSSPLRRCAGLARQLSASLSGQAIIFDARLAEMDFGNWELRAWNDIPREEIDAWAQEVVAYRPGGGERVLQVAERVGAFHDDLLQSSAPSAAIICHAGTIRMLLACRRGLTVVETARFAAGNTHKIAYGEVFVLDL
jgi:alpha-ribazole phosphatase